MNNSLFWMSFVPIILAIFLGLRSKSHFSLYVYGFMYVLIWFIHPDLIFNALEDLLNRFNGNYFGNGGSDGIVMISIPTHIDPITGEIILTGVNVGQVLTQAELIALGIISLMLGKLAKKAVRIGVGGATVVGAMQLTSNTIDKRNHDEEVRARRREFADKEIELKNREYDLAQKEAYYKEIEAKVGKPAPRLPNMDTTVPDIPSDFNTSSSSGSPSKLGPGPKTIALVLPFGLESVVEPNTMANS